MVCASFGEPIRECTTGRYGHLFLSKVIRLLVQGDTLGHAKPPSGGDLGRIAFDERARSCRSECQYGDLRMVSGKSLDVFEISACDERELEFESGCNDEGVDSVSGRHAGGGEEGAGALRDGSGQFDYSHDIAAQELVDGRIQTAAPTDLSQDR
jgi:hypothetical protein